MCVRVWAWGKGTWTCLCEDRAASPECCLKITDAGTSLVVRPGVKTPPANAGDTGLPAQGFAGDSGSKNSTYNAGVPGSILGLGRTPGEGNGNPLQSSCLVNPMDCSLPGSSVHGIFQAIVLQWIAISFSRGSSQPRDRTRVSSIVDRRLNIWATLLILYVIVCTS